MFDIVDAIGDKFVKAVDKEMKITNTLEVRQLSMKFTTDVISSVAFGIDSNCEWEKISILNKKFHHFL